jgi:predicted ATPase
VIVEVFSPNQDHLKTYEYEISVAGSFEQQQITIVRESLIVESGSEKQTLFEVKMGEGSWYWNNSIQPLRFVGTQSALEILAMPDFAGAAFRNVVSSWRFYDLMPLNMRKENPPTPQRFLEEHGDNFSAWLFKLQEYPEEFLHLKQAALDVLPSLSEILFESTQTAGIRLGSRETYLHRPIGLRRMSNGELAFLALLPLIMAPDELAAPLYCVEEPESHLHPHLLESLVELMNQRQQELGARAAQILMTTHSPQLVDWMRIGDLLVVQKVDGATRFVHPSSDQHLRDLVSSRESGLGELWFSGALERS